MPISPTLPPGTPQAVKTAFARLFEHATNMERLVGTMQGQSGQSALSMDQIRAALQAGGSHPLNLQNLIGTSAGSNPFISSGGGGGGGGGKAFAPNHADIANAVWAELGINPGSTDQQLFKYAQTVVWRIAQIQDPTDPMAGLLMQAGGDGTYNCGGQLFAVFRFCYNNGANIKILTGSYTAQWSQESDVPLTDWHAPTDPATVCP